MGIDGVGRPTPGAAPVGPGEPGAATGPAHRETFEVGSKVPAEGVSENDPLARVQRGELSVDDYLELRVDDAIKPFEERLGPEQLGFVRDSLRDQLRSDPVLVDLVARTLSASSRE